MEMKELITRNLLCISKGCEVWDRKQDWEAWGMLLSLLPAVEKKGKDGHLAGYGLGASNGQD